MAGEELCKNDILITICNFNIVVIFAYFNWWCQLASTIHKSYLVHMIILFKMRKYLLHLHKFYYVWRIIDFFLQKAPFSTLKGPKLSKPSLLISFHLKTKAPQIHKQNLTIRFRDRKKKKRSTQMVKVRMNTADVAAEVKCLRRLIGMRCSNVYDLSPKVSLSLSLSLSPLFHIP